MNNEKLQKTQEFDPGLTSIIEGAYDLVDEKYGVNSEHPKNFHNLVHTANVVEAAMAMADKALANGKIKPNDKKLIAIAAAYHDTEQQLGGGANETASAVLALEAMRQIGTFSQIDEQDVTDMIMATKIYFDENGIMRQSASDDYRTQIIADADLSHLGGPTELYEERFISLFREFNPTLDTDDDKFKAFLKNQEAFMQNHSYYTSEASNIFNGKDTNIEYTKDLVSSIVD